VLDVAGRGKITQADTELGVSNKSSTPIGSNHDDCNVDPLTSCATLIEEMIYVIT